jgi:ubiquitin carboxyl-terminal hydrolase L5
MAPPTKKRKVNGNHTNGDDATNGTLNSKVFPNPPLVAATPIDKQRWQGFCEIESEPVSLAIDTLDLNLLP